MPQTVGAVHHACVHSVRCYGVGKRIGSRSNGSSVLTAGVQHSSVDGVQITGFFQTGGKMSFPQERKGQRQTDRQQKRTDTAYQLDSHSQPSGCSLLAGAAQDSSSSRGPLTYLP